MNIQALIKPLFVIALTALIGCQPQTEPPPQAKEQTQQQPTGKQVAVVNGEVITEQALTDYLKRKQQAQPNEPPKREAALNELITMELVEQEAEKSALSQRADIIAELDQQRTRLLVDTFLRERLEQTSFSQGELKKEYDTQVARLSNTEYKARHVLTETEDQAKDVIKALDEGADFAALAKDKSKGPSGPQGGDLGWFRPAAMVPPFAEAVQKMTAGQYSKAPVKTEFGWHVILLEDTRETAPPAFEEVKDKLQTILANKSLQAYLEELRTKADIQMN